MQVENTTPLDCANPGSAGQLLEYMAWSEKYVSCAVAAFLRSATTVALNAFSR